MRIPTVLTGLLLAASLSHAVPILVTLEDSGPGGIGPIAFTFDMLLQPHAPYAFEDANEFSGDHVLKQGDYRIQVADYFRVERDGWTGYGYNWLLEVSPPGLGIYEQYCEVRFFTSPGETLILQGAWTTFWSEDTPIYASLQTGSQVAFSDMHISEIREVAAPTVPEPASLALFAAGLGAVAGAGWLRRRRDRAPSV